MARWEPGEVVPWEPIPAREPVPVPGNEQNIDDLIAGRTEVGGGVDRDDDLLNELTRIQRELGASGGNGRNGRPPTAPYPDEPMPPADILAWYVTFRSLDRWGVYISRQGRRTVAHALLRTGANPQAAHDTSWYLLRNHETAHFLVDRAVLTLESSLLAATGRRPTLWLDRKNVLRPDDLEEAVCNAYAYRMAAAHRSPLLKQIKHFMRNQPAGYRDLDFDTRGRGRNASPDGLTRYQAESQLLTNYLAGSTGSVPRVVGLDSLMGYKHPETGTDGDMLLRVSDHEKRQLPVYRVP